MFELNLVGCFDAAHLIRTLCVIFCTSKSFSAIFKQFRVITGTLKDLKYTE